MIVINVRPIVNRSVSPAINTRESDQNYVLELALPGWQKEMVDLRIDGKLLIVSGELPTPENETQYRRREFGITTFEKSFFLPASVDIEQIQASLDHGVLIIELPKVQAAQPVRKQIAIA